MSRKRRRSSKPSVEPEPTRSVEFVADSRFVAARELFELARERVTIEDVRRFAPGDPGYGEYVAAFTELLRRGEAALRSDFAVTETIALTRFSHANSEGDPKRFRWFRMLGCAVEILLDRCDWPHYAVAALIVDCLALAQANDRAAPLDRLSAICREVAASGSGDDELLFCTLGELVLAGVDRLDDAAIERLCAELEPHENLWTCTCFDALHPVWLDLVDKRCPVHPPVALALRKRLLNDGARWMRAERKLS